jgi:DNA-binding protein YbaB
MFDKLKQGKQLLDLRNQAKKMQAELAQITETADKGDWHVKVSGDQKVVFISKGDERMKELEDAINDAFKNVQKKSAQKMMETEGLKGLLGNLGQ